MKEEYEGAKVKESDEEDKDDDETADDELLDGEDEDAGPDVFEGNQFPELYPGDMSMYIFFMRKL